MLKGRKWSRGVSRKKMRKRLRNGDRYRWCIRCERAWSSGAWEESGGCPGRYCDAAYHDYQPWSDVLVIIPEYPPEPVVGVPYPLVGVWW